MGAIAIYTRYDDEDGVIYFSLLLFVIDPTFSCIMLNCYTGELKEFKAYKKWAKEVSAIKPPTSPLRRRK